jgi:hypothetical protein
VTGVQWSGFFQLVVDFAVLKIIYDLKRRRP